MELLSRALVSSAIGNWCLKETLVPVFATMLVQLVWMPVEDWGEIYKPMTFDERERAQRLA
jgi:hypothetical protein